LSSALLFDLNLLYHCDELVWINSMHAGTLRLRVFSSYHVFVPKMAAYQQMWEQETI